VVVAVRTGGRDARARARARAPGPDEIAQDALGGRVETEAPVAVASAREASVILEEAVHTGMGPAEGFQRRCFVDVPVRQPRFNFPAGVPRLVLRQQKEKPERRRVL
jgi:hypothetical protein